MDNKVIDIDGSVMEGGGQVLRIALSVSCIKRIPIRLFNIRAGRSKSGLLEQHLKCVELLRDISKAQVTGASFGSKEITFRPGKIAGGSFEAYIKTAGSICLLMQAVLPCALFAPSAVTLRLKGGTNAEMAPQIDYATEVFRPVLEKFGGTFDFDLVKRGYFPKGGGEVVINVEPIDRLDPINLTERGNIVSIIGWSFVAGTLPMHLAKTMAEVVRNEFSSVCTNINIEAYKEDKSIAPDNASGIVLVAQSDTGCVIGADALGNRKETCEATGKRAAHALDKTLKEGACLDMHCQDQVIVFMALASGESSVKVGEITMHTKTAIFVVESLTNVRFTVKPQADGTNIIHCSGS